MVFPLFDYFSSIGIQPCEFTVLIIINSWGVNYFVVVLRAITILVC